MLASQDAKSEFGLCCCHYLQDGSLLQMFYSTRGSSIDFSCYYRSVFFIWEFINLKLWLSFTQWFTEMILLHKIRQNTDFHWHLFFPIRTGSTILPLHGRKPVQFRTVQWKPVFSHIFMPYSPNLAFPNLSYSINSSFPNSNSFKCVL